MPITRHSRRMTFILILIASMMIVAFYIAFTEFQHYLVVPLSPDEKKLYANHNPKALVVYPLFTQVAYGKGGFYDYYKGKCDKRCLTLNVVPSVNATYTTGINTYKMLRDLNYTVLSDYYLGEHPEIFKKFDRIVFLHEEYVTPQLFNMFSNKNHTMYLFPNSLYAQISMNYTSGNMTLIRGHGYPNDTISNGFGWKYEFGTINEYDIKCDNYNFIKLGNQGYMLSCYPELLILHDRDILGYVKNFTNTQPFNNELSKEVQPVS